MKWVLKLQTFTSQDQGTNWLDFFQGSLPGSKHAPSYQVLSRPFLGIWYCGDKDKSVRLALLKGHCPPKQGPYPYDFISPFSIKPVFPNIVIVELELPTISYLKSRYNSVPGTHIWTKLFMQGKRVKLFYFHSVSGISSHTCWKNNRSLR